MKNEIEQALKLIKDENKETHLTFNIKNNEIELIENLTFSDYEQLIYSFIKNESIEDCKNNIYKSLEELLSLCRTVEQQENINSLMFKLSKV